jgi:hypothetical protein
MYKEKCKNLECLWQHVAPEHKALSWPECKAQNGNSLIPYLYYTLRREIITANKDAPTHNLVYRTECLDEECERHGNDKEITRKLWQVRYLELIGNQKWEA